MTLYTIFDLSSSSITFQDDNPRIFVYIFLGAIIVFKGFYILFNLSSGIKINSTLFIMILITLWITIVNLITDNNKWIGLIHIILSIWWLFSIIFTKTFLLNNQGSEKHFKVLSFLTFLYYLINSIITSLLRSKLYDDVVALNIIYRLLVFIPILLLISNNKIKYFGLFIIFPFVLLSFKRGAIIIFPLMLLISLIVKSLIENRPFSYLGKIIIFIIVVILSIYIFDNLFDGIISSRFSIEQLLDGSNRRNIYSFLINDIKSRDLLTLFIGSGSGTGPSAHNELLEFLYSYGIIGLILFIIFIISLFKKFIKLYKKKSKLAISFSTLLVYITLTSLFSGFYFVHGTVYLMIYYGICDALLIKENTIRKTTT